MSEEIGENSSQENKYKRKRKKTFLQNARKYGKKGCYGRGSQLDADTYQYFVRIMEVYKEGFPNEEEKSIFVNNVFQQTEEQEINISSNQLGCRVIQMLLPFASDTFLEKYMQAFLSDLRPLCSDRFASHVLQTLLEVSCKKSLQTDVDEEFREKCRNNTLKISKFLLNNLEDYVWDTYGNHIIRTVFKNLAQLPPEDEKNKPVTITKSEEDQNKDVELPEEYTEVVKDYAQRLIVWPQFCDLPYSEITSGLLQILLKALAKLDTKQLKAYIKKFLNESFAINAEEDENEKDKNQTDKLLDVFMSKPAMMLLETSIELAPSKLYTQIYAKCFINKVFLLATTRSTNFSVQKLLNHCKEKAEFEAMFDELAEHFPEILDAGHSGVILSLAESCQRVCAKQGSFMQNIMKCFNCFEPEERQSSIVMCLCRFVNYEGLSAENIDLQKAKLNLHGALILQRMLEFNKPIKIVNSILELTTLELKALFSNSMGSHIVDSYVKSQYVGEKSREKLLRKMQSTYQDLASTKYGSRSFEAMWNVASLKYKMIIMNELVYKDAAWSNSEFGRIIASKVNLVLYKRNVDEWKNSFNKVSKSQALLADIIGE